MDRTSIDRFLRLARSASAVASDIRAVPARARARARERSSLPRERRQKRAPAPARFWVYCFCLPARACMRICVS